ncbi:MAG: dephospho-CoA kinase [Acidobacteriota bacterium]
MFKVGLTGGIASGKSTVCRMLEAKGCVIIDADKEAHRLLLKGEACYLPAVTAFGHAILRADGEIDRGRLGQVVFEDESKLDLLNSIVHPHVISEILSKLDIIGKARPEARVVVDASLMIESGFHRRFKGLVVVWCGIEQQVERLMQRNAMSESQARKRIALQMPLEEKVKLADWVIDNSGPLAETERQVETIVEIWAANSWIM